MSTCAEFLRVVPNFVPSCASFLELCRVLCRDLPSFYELCRVFNCAELCRVFKSFEEICAKLCRVLKPFFMPDSNCKTRENRRKLKIPKLSNSAARTNFIAVRIVPVWNSLTDEITLCGNYYTFCKQLESVDLSKYLKRKWDIFPWSWVIFVTGTFVQQI